MKMTKAKYTGGVICAAVICMNSILQPVCAEEIANMSTNVYVVMDANSGKILYSKNENQMIYPASTVKLVTAMVVLDVVPADMQITITSNMLNTFTSDVAQVGLRAGGTYSVYELLQLLLVSSAADAGSILAVGCFGSSEACVQKMNEKAAALGLQATHFDNVAGLDIGNHYTETYTTAAEFAVLSKEAMSYPVIREVVETVSYSLPARTNNYEITRTSTNQLLNGIYTYPTELYTVIGSKTGETGAAGNTLVATAKAGEHEVICASFANSTKYNLYTSVRTAFDYVFTLEQAGLLDLAEKNEIKWEDGNQITGNPTVVGWIYTEDGSWNYYLADGNKMTGWYLDKDNAWYFMDNRGRMQTGWIQWNREWYYLEPSGKMAISTTIADGYTVDENGIWIQE